MATVLKAKNARSKRALEKREPKVIENPKTVMLVRGSKTSNIVQQALRDLCALKKPYSISLSKRNELFPFENETPLEFLSLKNDASLFVFGSHSKKRPHSLVFGRIFDHKLFDMFEFHVSHFQSLLELKGQVCASGTKPLLVFSGMSFNQDATFSKLKNLFLDFFNLDNASSVCLSGLQHVISFTVFDSPPSQPSDSASSTDPSISTSDSPQLSLYIRSYFINLEKSGHKEPYVSISPMGPDFNLLLKRYRLPSDDIWKSATRIPKELYFSKTKNVSSDPVGNKLGRVHVGIQNIDKIQTRKVKALKKPRV
ncbi:hypothetical protein BB560_000105 [Smittium megazygosporum]|uniref:Ribosome production factor 2 homolog n=1 Tax=Smittium megazygosporum TaxID=133381 RepID=A0A2T9ZLB2_9FUNG|nr:hypothetical protein BB560_000108 [Smittium megazygosporum]PVV05381.1 hypothetical protein BB560_000105 [Smittium megazygosporum]